MKSSTSALFFDGKTALPNTVTVELSDEGISFEYENFLHTWIFADMQNELSGKKLKLFNSKNEEQLLIEDGFFVEKFFDKYHNIKPGGFYHSLLKGGAIGYSIILLLIGGILLGVWFFIIPWMAMHAADMLPESYDEKLGNVAYQNMIDQSEIDSLKSVQLKNFASQLNFGTSRHLNFTVLQSNQVNAFALPDGNIVVFSELYDQCNKDELAALLGHEASHVINRHSMKSLCASIGGFLVLSVAVGDVNGIMAVLAQNANQLNTLSYSRKFEDEADEKGLRIMVNNHFNPDGMLSLFKKLKEEEKENKLEVPAFIRSHPLTDERIKRTEERIKKLNS